MNVAAGLQSLWEKSLSAAGSATVRRGLEMCPQGKIEVECIRGSLPYRFVKSRQRRSKLTAKVRVGEEKVV
jgi:hypothetical protein